MESKLKISAIVPPLIEPPGSDRIPDPERRFLITIEPVKTIGDLYESIYERYRRFYHNDPTPRDPLFIVKLQDEDANDLAHDDSVGDIFNDTSKPSQVVKVIRGHVDRYSSIPPDTGLRPQKFRSLPGMRKRSAQYDEPFNKRSRLGPIPEQHGDHRPLNPHKAVLSREHSLPGLSPEIDDVNHPHNDDDEIVSEPNNENDGSGETSSVDAASEDSEADSDDGQDSQDASSSDSDEERTGVTDMALSSVPQTIQATRTHPPMAVDERACLDPASSPPSNQHHARRLLSSTKMLPPSQSRMQDGFRIPTLPARLRQPTRNSPTPQPSSQTSTPEDDYAQQTPTKPRAATAKSALYEANDVWDVPRSSHERDLGLAMKRKESKDYRPPGRAITKDRAFEAVHAARKSRDEGSRFEGYDKSSLGAGRKRIESGQTRDSDEATDELSSDRAIAGLSPMDRYDARDELAGTSRSAGRRAPPVAGASELGHHSRSFAAKNTFVDSVLSPESKSARQAKERYVSSNLERKKPPFKPFEKSKSDSRVSDNVSQQEASATPPMPTSSLTKRESRISDESVRSGNSRTPSKGGNPRVACRSCQQQRRKCNTSEGQVKCDRCAQRGIDCILPAKDGGPGTQRSESTELSEKKLKKQQSVQNKGKSRVLDPFTAAQAAAQARKERQTTRTGPSYDSSSSEDDRMPARFSPKPKKVPGKGHNARAFPSKSSDSDSDSDDQDSVQQEKSDEEDPILQDQIQAVVDQGGRNISGRISTLISSTCSLFSNPRSEGKGVKRAWHEVSEAPRARPGPAPEECDVMGVFTPRKKNKG